VSNPGKINPALGPVPTKKKLHRHFSAIKCASSIQSGTDATNRDYNCKVKVRNFANEQRDVSKGCQMEYFHTKNPNLGIFGRALEWKLLVYFMAVLNIFGIYIFSAL
jgi:hypothetical protein